MSAVVQYELQEIKLNGWTFAIFFTAEPKSYVKFNGATLLITYIRSIVVRQVPHRLFGSRLLT